jgi:GT2 family glycosyltransferase
MSATPHVTVIVPTKSRPAPLERLVSLLLRQTRVPQHLVIVDQSSDGEARERVKTVFEREGPAKPRLTYLLDPSVPGAAVARNRGMDVADGEIWLFLDDDMEPEVDFIEQLLKVYQEDPFVSGVSGIVSNYGKPSYGFRVWAHIFQRGPFHDQRQPIYWRAEELRDSPPIRVPHFGSGLMSFRAQAIRGVRFDESLRGLPPGEDLDFCERLGPSTRLVIAPRARIAHSPSAVGRTREYWIKEYAQGKLYVYHRNWRVGLVNRMACAWFEFGCGLVALVASFRRLSLRPWLAFLAGVQEASRLSSPGPELR